MEDPSRALVELGRELRAAGYAFVTVTPETHRRFLTKEAAHGRERAASVRDVLGWTKPFAAGVLPPRWLELLRAANAVEQLASGLLRARVRASTLEGELFFHSAFPTTDADAVFFGPDTYRYCRAITQEARAAGGGRRRRIVDVGCGAGPGGILAVRAGWGDRVVLADVNAGALRLAEVNAAIAGIEDATEVLESDVLGSVTGGIDVVIANPPYLRDPGKRTYRDGGGSFGEALAVRIVREALGRIASGGRILVYTGAVITAGEDTFLREVAPVCREAGARFRYEELDPDVFGEELETPAYAAVDRIAAVALNIETR